MHPQIKREDKKWSDLHEEQNRKARKEGANRCNPWSQQRKKRSVIEYNGEKEIDISTSKNEVPIENAPGPFRQSHTEKKSINKKNEKYKKTTNRKTPNKSQWNVTKNNRLH